MRTSDFLTRYTNAKQDVLSNGISLTKAEKKYHIKRQTLSRCLKEEGYTVVNRQNASKFNEHIFDKIDNSEKAYWLGFLYADGAVSKDRNTVELSLKASDIEHLRKFRDFLGFDKNKTIFCDDVRCRLQFSNKHTKYCLCKLGCLPQKSLILTFPSEQQVSNKFIKDFIRGYIDGDGSIMLNTAKTCGRLNILGTKAFLESLVSIMGWKRNSIQKRGNIFSIEWCGYYVLKYLEEIYSQSDVYLDRKYQKFLQIRALQNCRLKE